MSASTGPVDANIVAKVVLCVPRGSEGHLRHSISRLNSAVWYLIITGIYNSTNSVQKYFSATRHRGDFLTGPTLKFL